MHKDSLELKFAKIGLNPNEQKVYLEILKAGKIAPARVAKLTKINRTTVYSIARKLAELKLISLDIGGKNHYLLAENINNIQKLFRKEEIALQEKKAASMNLIKELSLITSNRDYSIPRIKVIEESDLTTYLYDQYKIWARVGQKEDNTWWGFHDHSFTENYGKWIDWCWKQGPRDMKVRFFTNETPAEKQMTEKHPERQLRFFKNFGFDASVWLIGNYIIMVKTREKPHYMIEINDEVLSRNFKEFFKGMWALV